MWEAVVGCTKQTTYTCMCTNKSKKIHQRKYKPNRTEREAQTGYETPKNNNIFYIFLDKTYLD